MKFIRLLALPLAGWFAITAQADTYRLDPAHTSVGFTISHLVISEVAGRFNEVEGEITLTDGALTGAKATIQAKSIDTQIAKRDDHLRNADFFNVEKYPTLTFESTQITKEGDKFLVTGKFTMHGTTKEIKLPVTLRGPIQDPWGKTRIGLLAETTLDRTDYGMKPFPGVGNEVKIRLAVQGIKVEEQK